MSRNLKLTVGQKVAVKIEDNSNASRYVDMSLENMDKWCFEGEVTKVGRKYITVKFMTYKEEQFSIEDNYRQKYTWGGADYKLYLSKEEAIEEIEAEIFYRQVKYEFDSYKNNSKFTLDQLKRIKNIIKEE